MTDDEVRDVLRRVAQGELDPDEAARLLDGDASTADEAAEDFVAAAGSDETARRLHIAGRGRKIRIMGDASVRELLVRGRHSMRRDGEVLRVDCDPIGEYGEEQSLHGLFAVVGGGPPWTWGREGDWGRRDWERRGRSEHRRRMGPPQGFQFASEPLEVRANPDLALTLDLVAGAVRCSDMHGPIDCSMTAGSVVLAGVNGPLQVSVSAGSLAVQGPISRGASRIDCDMGSVKVRLDPGADVRVKVESEMSRADVRLGDWSGKAGRGEWVVGNGTASLDISSSMGSVKIREGSVW
jgi:hypothetical protein